MLYWVQVLIYKSPPYYVVPFYIYIYYCQNFPSDIGEGVHNPLSPRPIFGIKTKYIYLITF